MTQKNAMRLYELLIAFIFTPLFLIDSDHIPLNRTQLAPASLAHIQGKPFWVTYGKIQLDFEASSFPPFLIQYTNVRSVIVQYTQMYRKSVQFF